MNPETFRCSRSSVPGLPRPRCLEQGHRALGHGSLCPDPSGWMLGGAAGSVRVVTDAAAARALDFTGTGSSGQPWGTRHFGMVLVRSLGRGSAPRGLYQPGSPVSVPPRFPVSAPAPDPRVCTGPAPPVSALDPPCLCRPQIPVSVPAPLPVGSHGGSSDRVSPLPGQSPLLPSPAGGTLGVPRARDGPGGCWRGSQFSSLPLWGEPTRLVLLH